jgi:hypothetical protein
MSKTFATFFSTENFCRRTVKFRKQAISNVIKAIQQSLNDPDPDVREEAENVLKKNHIAKP